MTSPIHSPSRAGIGVGLGLALSVAAIGSSPWMALADEAKAPAESPRRAAAAGVTVERIAAVVNSEIVLLSEVKERAAQVGPQNAPPVDESSSPEAKAQYLKTLHQVLDRMVDDILVLQQAGELKLSVEEAEVDRAVDQVRESNKLDAEQFKQAVTDQGFTMTAFRRDMKKQILRMKTINNAVRSRLNISEEDVKAFYEQNARQSGGHREAHVRHVLVAVPEGADAKTVEAKRRVAARVLEEARAGGDFEKLAKANSDDSYTKSEGGDLGWLKEGEGLSEAMNEVIFSMEQKGEVRGPIKTDKGFEVLQLLERKEGDVRPYSEVKDQIRAQLTNQQIEKQTATWVQELRRKAHLDVRL